MNQRLVNALLTGALAVSLLAHLLPTAESGRAEPALPTVDELGLDAAQVQDLQTCCEGVCTVDDEIRSSIGTVTTRLQSALTQPDLDADLVRNLGDELAELQARRVKNCIDSVLLVRGVLSPTQVEQLQAACCTEEGE